MKSQLNELKNILNKINKLEKISEFKSMIESGFKFTLLFFVITLVPFILSLLFSYKNSTQEFLPFFFNFAFDSAYIIVSFIFLSFFFFISFIFKPIAKINLQKITQSIQQLLTEEKILELNKDAKSISKFPNELTFDSLSNLCFDVQQNINKNTFVIDNYLKIKKIVEVFILIEEHKIQKIKDQDNQSEKQQYLQALSSNHTTKYEYTPPIKFFEKR